MSLAKPNKHLAYSEDHFEGYWARLTALIRHNDEADYILDELLTSPLLSLTILDDDNNLRAALTALYTERGLTYPTKKTIEEDPLTSIRNFLISTQSSEDEAIAAWKALNLDDLKRYRKGIKYIYEVAVATLSVAEATEFLGDLPYGLGIKLLQRIKEKQRRQTSMSLFVLFDNVLSLKLKTGEKLSTLFSRMMALRQRLSNWTPPIMLPDQLVLVCILRALPTKYHLEGPCHHHPNAGHALSECWKEHPELNPFKTKSASVHANAAVATPMKSETLYGFLLGDCLICAPTPETSDIAKIDTIPAYQTENVRQASSGKPVIVDSGSCSHICNEKTALTHLKQSPINGIRDVSGTISSVTGMGNTQTLTDVMLVPTSTHQLLSVGKLADQFGGEVVFTNKTVELRTAQGTKRVGSRSSDGLYTVTHPEFLFKRQTQTCAPISKEGKSLIGRSQVSLQMLKERMLRLHRIFGHANKEKLRTILKNNPSLKINPDHVKLLPGCRACSLGKVKRAPKPKLATTKAQSFAERIVADCSGR